MLEGFDASQKEELKDWIDSEATQALLKSFEAERNDIIRGAFADPDKFMISKGRKEQMDWVIDQIQTAHKEE